MDEAAGSLPQNEESTRPGDGDLRDSAVSLRPEYAVLKEQFRLWQLELQRISTPSAYGTNAMASFREPQQIVEIIHNEFLRFDRQQPLVAEPEDLRRLLRRGLTATSRLRIRCDAMTEADWIAQRTSDISRGLLRESSPIEGRVGELLDDLRSTTGFDRTWKLCEPEIDRIVHTAGGTFPRHCRYSWQNLLAVAVLSARIAIRVCESLALTRRETTSVLTASLLQDCGFLLLERQHHCSPRQLAVKNPEVHRAHPRFSAALAAGVLRIPSESLAAIAAHHSHVADDTSHGTARWGRVACIVAEVSKFVDAFRSRPAIQRHRNDVVLDPLRIRTAHGYQRTVLQTLISVLERGLPIETPPSDPVSSEISAQDSSVVAAPHFSRPALQPDPADQSSSPFVSR